MDDSLKKDLIEQNIDSADHSNEEYSRRDFLNLTSSVAVVVGSGCLLYPFINSMDPAADVKADSEIEVDISHIKPGEAATVKWRGKPVFIRKRTPEEIIQEQQTNLSQLMDPATDENRVKKQEWVILIGVCTHLGCVPTGQKNTDNKGEFGGWFCPCHGSVYDTLGRVRKGPAPKNLPIPPYVFINDTTVCIGREDKTKNV